MDVLIVVSRSRDLLQAEKAKLRGEPYRYTDRLNREQYKNSQPGSTGAYLTKFHTENSSWEVAVQKRGVGENIMDRKPFPP